jgi:cytoskeletal protein CcmA (bactofilin family)
VGRIVRFLVTYLTLALAANLCATEFKSADSFILSSQNRIADDLIVTGKNVKIDGEVEGDLVTFCRSNAIKGKVYNSVFNFSQYFDHSGQIEGSLSSFCQDLTLSGKVGRNLTAFAASVYVTREAVIQGQLIAFCGDFDLEGEVLKGVRVHCDEAVISGHVKGDLKLEADRVVIMEGAVIEGNLNYRSPKEAKIDSMAQIKGEVKWSEKKKKDEKGSIYRKIGVFNTALMAGNLVTGVILIALFRQRWNRSQVAVKTSFLKSLGLGLVLAICVPIAAIILLVTILGIPIAILSLVGYLVVLYLAKLIFSTTMGVWILKFFKKQGEVSLIWAFLVGYVAFWLVTGFDVIGTIIYILAFFVGFGALVLGNRESKPAVPLPTATPTAS